MPDRDRSNYAKKHGPGKTVPESLAENIRSRCSDKELTCPTAFEVAEIEGVKPSEVGAAADLMGFSIVRCSLGLFGYRPAGKIVEPAAEVSPGLESAINGSLVKGRLPCVAAWEIAGNLNIEKMRVSAACEALGVKIKPCQLGAF